MSPSHLSPQARHLHTPSAATPFHFFLGGKSSQVFLVLFELRTQILSAMRFALQLEDGRVILGRILCCLQLDTPPP